MKHLAFAFVLLLSVSVIGQEVTKDSILAELSDNERKYVEFMLSGERELSFNLVVGEVGKFQDREQFIIQVIDEKNMLAKVNLTKPAGKFNDIERVQCWLEGYDTKGATDEKVFAFDTVWLVAGTKKYDTALGGTNTVKHLVSIKTKKADKAARKLIELREFRNWKSKDGTRDVFAKYIGFKSGVVKLKDESGNEIEFKKTDLSEPDQTWIRDELKRRNSKK